MLYEMFTGSLNTQKGYIDRTAHLNAIDRTVQDCVGFGIAICSYHV